MFQGADCRKLLQKPFSCDRQHSHCMGRCIRATPPPEAAPVRRQADCDYYHRVRAAGLSVHGCYAGRVYDMAVVAPGLPEGRGYDRDAALAALVRLGALRGLPSWSSLRQPAPHLLGMQTAPVFGWMHALTLMCRGRTRTVQGLPSASDCFAALGLPRLACRA
jgi:hypothetical protein